MTTESTPVRSEQPQEPIAPREQKSKFEALKLLIAGGLLAVLAHQEYRHNDQLERIREEQKDFRRMTYENFLSIEDDIQSTREDIRYANKKGGEDDDALMSILGGGSKEESDVSSVTSIAPVSSH